MARSKSGPTKKVKAKKRSSPSAKRGPKSHYEPAAKVSALIALDANGGDIPLTARQLGIPSTTLNAWAKGDNCVYLRMLCAAYKGDMAKAFQDVAWLSLSLALEKAPQAEYRALMTGAGIAVDKMRLLMGDATQIIDNRGNVSPVTINIASLSVQEQYTLYQLMIKANSNTAPSATNTATNGHTDRREPNTSGPEPTAPGTPPEEPESLPQRILSSPGGEPDQ